MTTRPVNEFLQHLRAFGQKPEDVSDAELLDRFVRHHEAAAIEAIVRRYAPMVWGVCRRRVARPHDAEDAFQATFLVLVRRAGAIRRRELLANWLYGVALQTSRKTQQLATKRWLREQQVMDMPEPKRGPLNGQADLQAALDEEIGRLPDKYRAVIILCELQGQSRARVARQLRLAEGTVASRLARARALLAKRLTRREMALSAIGLAGILADQASACVPATVVSATVRNVGLVVTEKAAAAVAVTVWTITEGVVRTMLLNKLKIMAGVVVLAAIVLGAGWRAQSILAAQARQSEKPSSSAGSSASTSAPASAPVDPALAKAAMDPFGDPLPPGALVRTGTVRFHALGSGPLAYSPDGKMLATGGECFSQLWDVATGKVIHTLRHDDGGNQPGTLALAFSPDGKFLATGHWHRVRLWDVATGKEASNHDAFWGGMLTFTRDSKTLIYAWGGTLVQVETATGNKLPDLEVIPLKQVSPGTFEGGQIKSLAFTRDGKTLATGSTDKLIRLLEYPSGREIRRLEGHTVSVEALAFSLDGKTLASTSGGFDNIVRLWETATGKEQKQISDVEMGGRGNHVELIYCPDGKSFAVGGQLIDADTGEKIRSIPFCFAFAPDGKTMAVPGFRVLDVATGKQTLPQPAEDEASAVNAVAFSPDGKTLASADGSIRLWDAATGKKLRAFAANSGSQSLTYSPDGKTLTTDGGVWEADTGKQMRAREGRRWSPDGKYRARFAAQSVKVWDADGKEIHDLTVNEPHRFSAVAFSPDGKILAAGYQCSTPRQTDDLRPGDQMWKIQLWEAATAKKVGNILVETKLLWGISFLAFSPDGKMLASANGNGIVRLWDLAIGKEILHVETANDVLGTMGRGRGTCTVVFSPDGKRLATLTSGMAVSVVRVWDLATRKEIHSIKGEGFYCMALAPDGKTLATGNADTTCTIWAVPSVPMEIQKLPVGELPRLWADLSSEDAEKADHALWTLVAAPEQSVPWLKEKLAPAERDARRAEKLAALIADLDSDDFVTRTKANAELEKQGALAEAALKSALESKPSLDVQSRIQALLEKLHPWPDMPLQSWRAVVVLERIGNDDARLVLKTLSEGDPDARLTQEAKAALERLRNLQAGSAK
jgi:RNA polymerase sigma factor (sigma-70 family)